MSLSVQFFLALNMDVLLEWCQLGPEELSVIIIVSLQLHLGVYFYFYFYSYFYFYVFIFFSDLVRAGIFSVPGSVEKSSRGWYREKGGRHSHRENPVGYLQGFYNDI